MFVLIDEDEIILMIVCNLRIILDIVFILLIKDLKLSYRKMTSDNDIFLRTERISHTFFYYERELIIL